MKRGIIIGETKFDSKKAALSHYKTILNSYKAGEYLDKSDLIDVIDLIEIHPNVVQKVGVGIENVKISKVRYNTNAFEIVRVDGTTTFSSYIKCINGPKSDFTKFREACRSAIQDDLTQVKQSYFNQYAIKSKVRCQETGELLAWEELVIDHRQPNTFSVIVDRFIELNKIDLTTIKYNRISGVPNELHDISIKEKFREYHKSKANLRIIKKSVNLGRSFQARVNRQKKDLRIE